MDVQALLNELGVSNLQIVSAAQLLGEPAQLGLGPGYLLNPIAAVLITEVDDGPAVRLALAQVYPAGHPM
ncbi:MAG TPA: hypothetical protein VK457_06805, partial [Chloroflexota bacterium]|nr:hypothetical protein [Chloroflexota bacterium]